MSVSQDNHPKIVQSASIEQLRFSLKTSTLLTPESDGYLESTKRWSIVCEKRPDIVVYAGSPEDISTAILFSRANGLDLAVCGGRHSTNGSSSTNDGLVIDLRNMREVDVDRETRKVVVQGGCIWEDVDKAAAAFDLAVVGGTINHTGVGGLTLGGGYGWLTGRHGLTIDSLLEVTMVMADGSIKKASAAENSDLFWAVRGAGQSFGVAVDFTFQGHHQEKFVWAGQMSFPANSKLEAVVQFANHLVEVTDGDSAMGIVLTWPPFMPEIMITAHLFYNGPKEAALKLFAPLQQMGPVLDTTAERPYSEVNGLMNKGTQHGARRTGKGAGFVTPLRPTFVRNILEALEQLFVEIPDARKTAIIFEFYSTKQSSKVAPMATSFGNRGVHQNAQVSPGWSDSVHDEQCHLWASKVAQMFTDDLERVKKERGNPESMESITEYGNYDGQYLQVPEDESGKFNLLNLGLGSARPQRIFGVNFRRVNQLKGIYDPQNVFNKPYPTLREDLYLPWDPNEAEKGPEHIE